MVENDDRRIDGATPRAIHIERKSTNWLPWLLLALGLLALLFFLSRWDRRDAVETTQTNTVVAATPDAAAPAGMSALGDYLAGYEPTPRTFTFDKLNFDTAKSDIRLADRADVNAVATTLKQFPNARVRIAGYADTRGSEASNVALGKARADSVRDALVAQGIGADRIETASGGETDPVDTNATSPGRAENRRTELVVLQR